MREFFKNLLVCPAVNGYSALLRSDEIEGGEEEECCTTSITPLPVQVRSSTITLRTANIGM